MDGLFLMDDFSFLNHTDGIGQQNLTNFTICWRHKLNFLRGVNTHILSYTSQKTDNALLIWLNKNEDDLLVPININACKYPFQKNRANECIIFQIGLKPFDEWQHFCFIVTSYETNDDEITSKMRLFYDGVQVQQSK